MASFSWTWTSDLIDDISVVVRAYFCGLPACPYQLASQNPFCFELVRGKRTAYWWALLMGTAATIAKMADLRTELTVTCRPTVQRTVDWSFKYNVFTSLYKCAGHSVEELGSALKQEVDGFVGYYQAFGRDVDRLPWEQKP